MELFRDVRYAARLLIKNRWFTVAAVVVLSLGIGATTAVFTIVDAVLLRNLPVQKPEQIMFLSTQDSQGRPSGVSLRDFEDWRAASRTFSGMSFLFNGAFNVGNEGLTPDQVPGAYVSANLFEMLAVPPARGRDFTPAEDTPGTPLTVLISDTLWRQRYGADPGIVGQGIRITDRKGTIVGVMPEGMHFPFDADIWVPAGALPRAILNQPRQARAYFAVGRLKDGVSAEQARAELRIVGQTLAARYPAANKDVWPQVNPFVERVLGPQLPLLFWALLGAVALVLLTACSNVANLLLAKAAGRAAEMSVRLAVGARRSQIVRQLLVESVLLACLAGVLGLLLSLAGTRWFSAEARNIGVPFWMVFSMDWRTAVFFLAVCLGTGVVFGLAPALHASTTALHERLKEGGRSGSSGSSAHRLTMWLIVGQLALTLVLLAASGSTLRSFLTMYRMDIGIDTSRLVVSSMIIPAAKYPEWEDRTRFLQSIDTQFAGGSAIEAASTATVPPFGGGSVRRLEIDGRPAAPGERLPEVTMLSVGSRYFDTIGAPILRGRAFTDDDGTPGRQSAIVNQRLASEHFGGRDPIGRVLRLSQGTPGSDAPEWLTVVGLVPNVRQRNNTQEPEPDPIAYIPHRQNTAMARTAQVIARMRSDPLRSAPLLRETMMRVDPDQALNTPRTLNELLAQQRWLLRVFTTMFTAFALTALVLAAVGLYAITAYSITQRTRDIGVHMVLGAQPGHVTWLFLKRSLLQLTIGLGVGLAVALTLGRLLQPLLVQTSSRDPLTLGAITMLLIVVSLAACLGPVRRATRLDPLDALRRE